MEKRIVQLYIQQQTQCICTGVGIFWNLFSLFSEIIFFNHFQTLFLGGGGLPPGEGLEHHIELFVVRVRLFRKLRVLVAIMKQYFCRQELLKDWVGQFYEL